MFELIKGTIFIYQAIDNNIFYGFASTLKNYLSYFKKLSQTDLSEHNI